MIEWWRMYVEVKAVNSLSRFNLLQEFNRNISEEIGFWWKKTFIRNGRNFVPIQLGLLTKDIEFSLLENFQFSSQSPPLKKIPHTFVKFNYKKKLKNRLKSCKENWIADDCVAFDHFLFLIKLNSLKVMTILLDKFMFNVVWDRFIFFILI